MYLYTIYSYHQLSNNLASLDWWAQLYVNLDIKITFLSLPWVNNHDHVQGNKQKYSTLKKNKLSL